MGLEAVTYISDLVATWPLGSDKIRQGDDHIRGVKRAIKNTLPNLSGPVTLTHTALNKLPEDFDLVLAEILEHVVPVGVITAWAGAMTSVPTGWALCNGQTVGGYGVVPDLRGKFIYGTDAAPGTVGGAASVSTGASGAHTPVIQNTALDVTQMPAHTHTGITVEGSADDNGFPGPLVLTQSFNPNGTSVLTNAVVASAGGGLPHTHAADAVADHTHTVATLPPYIAFGYIIKVTAYVAP